MLRRLAADRESVFCRKKFASNRSLEGGTPGTLAGTHRLFLPCNGAGAAYPRPRLSLKIQLILELVLIGGYLNRTIARLICAIWNFYVSGTFIVHKVKAILALATVMGQCLDAMTFKCAQVSRPNSDFARPAFNVRCAPVP